MLVGVQLLLVGSYLPPVFKSPLKGKPPMPPQTIISVPVHTAVCELLASGTLVVLVPVQLFVPGLYLPPVSKGCEKSSPPQTIISVPVQTAVWFSRASGTLLVLVAVHVFVFGLYLPPVSRSTKLKSSKPPQTIISVPVQIAVCERRAAGALLVVVAVQLSVPGLYRPPVFKSVKKSSTPPQTIISLPARTAVCRLRPSGAFVVLVGAQVFIAGLYL